MSSSNRLILIPSALALLGPVVSIEAFAEIYMSETDAQAVIFPKLSFTAKDIELSPSDVAKIEAASGQQVRQTKLKVWKATSGEVIFIDQVLGKHEFITYATGIDKNGKVVGVEILEYRESYGQAVRKKEWVHQFVGKDHTSALKVGDDIKNISGATLSSTHVTAGVKRLVQTYEQIKSRI